MQIRKYYELLKQGEELAKNKLYNSALCIFYRALKINKDDPYLYFNIFNCYVCKHEYDKALNNLYKCLDKCKHGVDDDIIAICYYNLSIIHMHMNYNNTNIRLAYHYFKLYQVYKTSIENIDLTKECEDNPMFKVLEHMILRSIEKGMMII